MMLRQYCEGLAFLFLGLIGAGAYAATLSAEPSLHLSAESPVGQVSGAVVGSGAHSYRFVVRDPQYIERPYRKAPYRIVLTGAARFPDGTAFYRGTTDARGRTAVFRFEGPVALSEWTVEPVAGDGSYHQGFVLTSHVPGMDMSNWPYMLNVSGGPLYCGRALPGGLTVRYSSLAPTSLQLYAGGDFPRCMALAKRVNPVMALPDIQGRIRGMEQLMRDSHLAAEWEILQDKIDELVVRQGTLAQVQALLQRQLAESHDAVPEVRASLYNSLAYELLTAHPPRHVAYAHQLVDQSLALEQNYNNLDTKAWALYQLGYYEEALAWLSRSLALFKAGCTEAERDAYSEVLAHQGMILWALRRWDEALTPWAQADMLETDGAWANFTPPWSNIEPLIQSQVARLQATGYGATVCLDKVVDQDESLGASALQ